MKRVFILLFSYLIIAPRTFSFEASGNGYDLELTELLQISGNASDNDFDLNFYIDDISGNFKKGAWDVKLGIYFPQVILENPPQVRIINVLDSEIPDVSFLVEIKNEGITDQEYIYEYCIVSNVNDNCNKNSIAYSSAAKLIKQNESWQTTLTLNLKDPGSYWFKIIVYYGQRKSSASLQFTATKKQEQKGFVTQIIQTPQPKFADIEIVELQRDIKIEQGSVEYLTIRIKNTGNAELKNLKVEITPAEWFEIIEQKNIIAPDEEIKILVKIKVPEDTREDDYAFDLSIKGDNYLKTTNFIVRVFEREKREIKIIDVIAEKMLPETKSKIIFTIKNVGNRDLNLLIFLIVPLDWEVEKQKELFLKAGEDKNIEFEIKTSKRSGIENLILVIKPTEGTINNLTKITREVKVMVHEKIEETKTEDKKEIFKFNNLLNIFNILLIILFLGIIIEILQIKSKINKIYDNIAEIRKLKKRKIKK